MKKYRPSNSTEGEAFMELFCYRCRRYSKGCDIEFRAVLNNEDSPDYPHEWIVDERGPRCTAYEA